MDRSPSAPPGSPSAAPDGAAEVRAIVSNLRSACELLRAENAELRAALQAQHAAQAREREQWEQARGALERRQEALQAELRTLRGMQRVESMAAHLRELRLLAGAQGSGSGSSSSGGGAVVVSPPRAAAPLSPLSHAEQQQQQQQLAELGLPGGSGAGVSPDSTGLQSVYSLRGSSSGSASVTWAPGVAEPAPSAAARQRSASPLSRRAVGGAAGGGGSGGGSKRALSPLQGARGAAPLVGDAARAVSRYQLIAQAQELMRSLARE